MEILYIVLSIPSETLNFNTLTNVMVYTTTICMTLFLLSLWILFSTDALLFDLVYDKTLFQLYTNKFLSHFFIFAYNETWTDYKLDTSLL